MATTLLTDTRREDRLTGSRPVEQAREDRTGRHRLVSNVLFTWGAQMVFFVAGFIMPRMIDRRLGQEVLGVWDFSWSVVTYFRLVELGITASVNRHVAKYWGKQDIAGVNRIVSSATFALAIAASVVLLATIIAVISLPHWFAHRLGEHLPAAQASVFFLGAMLSMGTALGAFNGVLTGCHRWELQSLRLGFWHFVTVAGMIVALWLGGGLVTLAVITAIGQTLGQLTMVTLAFRVCRGLRLSRSFVKRRTIKELYIFSGKSLLQSVSAMLLNQTTSLLILAHLGPAALAVFTRPRSLLLQMDTLERKMAMILTPTTSSLESISDLEEIKTLLLKSVRYSLYLVLPMVMVLIVFGGQVMQLWMGRHYANGLIPAILAVGFLAACVQTPILSILEGLNAHGRGGLAQLVASIISVGLAVLMLGYLHAGLVGTAVAVTMPLAVVNVVYLPRMMCRHLSLDLAQFFRQAVSRPAVHVLPFAACLVLARLLYHAHPLVAVVLILTGASALAISYWRCVLPARMKGWAQRLLGSKALSRVSQAAKIPPVNSAI